MSYSERMTYVEAKEIADELVGALVVAWLAPLLIVEPETINTKVVEILTAKYNDAMMGIIISAENDTIGSKLWGRASDAVSHATGKVCRDAFLIKTEKARS